MFGMLPGQYGEEDDRYGTGGHLDRYVAGGGADLYSMGYGGVDGFGVATVVYGDNGYGSDSGYGANSMLFDTYAEAYDNGQLVVDDQGLSYDGVLDVVNPFDYLESSSVWRTGTTAASTSATR